MLDAHCHPRFSVHCIAKPFHLHQFSNGLVWGAVALVLGLVLCAVLRDRRPLPVAGVLMAAAAAAALQASHELPGGLVPALALLVAGGVAADRFGAALAWRVVAAVPGAAVVATLPRAHDQPWEAALVFVVVVAGSALTAELDQRDGAVATVLFGVAVAAAYTTLPDLEEVLCLLGAVLPLLLLAWPFPLARLGGGGSAAVVGAFTWVAAFDARGRHTGLIGAVGCLGLLVVLPLARLLGARWRHLPLVPVVGVQVVVAYWFARVAGLRHQPSVAGALAVGGLVVCVGVARLVLTPRGGGPE